MRLVLRTTSLLFLICISSLGTTAPGQDRQNPQRKIDPELLRAMAESPELRADGIVYLEAKADLDAAYSIRDWEQRGQFVLNTLQAVARRSQSRLLQQINTEIRAGNVGDYTSYYIVNAVFVRAGTRKAFESIANLPEVRYIEKKKVFPLPEPAEFRSVFTSNKIQSTIAWGVSKIEADKVWSQYGAKGQGIVVANIDTGVNWQHAALKNQYRGMGGNHNYNWFDPTGTFPTAPGDNNNHGTHTMGTMVGDDGLGNQIGVAPLATWIAAKGCTNQGCDQNHLISAGQWMLAPTTLTGSLPNPAMRPRVVNNSWGSCKSNDPWYQFIVQAWAAADIVPLFSAGNNCAAIGAPGSYAESFASGATDINDVIASFSAHGPSPFTTLTKPDVTAPGVNILSSLAGGGYGVNSGTSMASPHTAGCAALILSAHPTLPAYQVQKLLAQTSVDLGAGGPDMTYGVGRINCLAAVYWSGQPWWQYQWGSGAGQFGLWNMNAGDKYIPGDYDKDGQDELLAVSVTGWTHLMEFTGASWQFVWGAGPNGKIGLWNMNPGDKYMAADYDGDGRDELLSVSTNGWAHLHKWNGSSWQFMWSTPGSNGKIGLWNISSGDKYLAADYDGDNRDELLSVSTNGWAHLHKWNGSSWQFMWSTPGSNGKIGLWNISPGDKYTAADFDGDGRDELLSVSTNGWAHLHKWNGSSWQFMWSTPGSNGKIGLWNINPGDKYIAADYDGDGRAELLSVSSTSLAWAHLHEWNGSSWQWLWGNAGTSQISLWNMNLPDQFVGGNFDASSGRDELFAIKKPWVHLMKYDF